jgi:NADH-quinone oxidoreductase subunit N/multicomponent Na+:H+ antiporter subunit D
LNAPIIWIGLPGLTAIFLWVTRRDERRTLFIGLGVSLLLILSSRFLSVGKPILQIGNLTLQISSSMTILGRSFTLGNGDLVYAALIFVILFLFCSMSFVVDIPVRFVPIGFLLTSLTLAALSVQPFLYAALLLEICVILSVILLSNFGEMPTTGVLRFLLYQSLAMPFMLASGWVLSAVEANPTETNLIFQALILLGLGFSFWLGVYPFNSWMPQVAGEKPPFSVGFVLILFNTATLILVIRYLDGFVWLRDDARIFQVLRYMGLLMILTSAVLFAMEKKIFRTTAYLISFETGMSLIAISLNQTTGWNSFIMMFLPRIIAIVLWVVLLSYIHQYQSQENEEESLTLHPVLSVGFSIAVFTIAGFPIFPGFITRLLVFMDLARVDITVLAWMGIAHLCFIGASVRFLIHLYSEYPFPPNPHMPRIEKIYFYVLSGLLLVMGLFPQMLLRSVSEMLQAFPNIK